MAHKYLRKTVLICRNHSSLTTFTRSFSTKKTSTGREGVPATETVTIAGYPIHYVKAGQGPHVVFCFPGILGIYKIHLLFFVVNNFSFQLVT